MRIRVAAVSAAGAAALAGSAVAQQPGGDWYRGAGLALRWCATCHVIDERGTGPAFAIPPPFPTVAKSNRVSPAYLRGWMSEAHTLMPEMALTERDKADLAAYILSFRHRER